MTIIGNMLQKIIKLDSWQNKKYRLYSFLFFYKKLFIKKLGKNVFIHPLVSIKNPHKLVIGNDTKIHRNVVLWGDNIKIGNNVQINPNTVIYGNVIIKDNVLIAPNCSIINGNHGMKKHLPMIYQKCHSKGPIIIEDDVWIGTNCSILDGVIIKKGTVIGAGSVVTKNTIEYGIYIGSPAKLIKKRK